MEKHQIQWIRVSEEVLRKIAAEPQKMSISGVSLNVRISPYDLPHQIKAAYENGIFRIDFRYIDNEAGVREPANDHVTATVGVFSRKVLAFEIKVDEAGLNLIELNLFKPVQESLDRMKGLTDKPNAQLNYDAVGSLLREVKDQLVPSGH